VTTFYTYLQLTPKKVTVADYPDGQLKIRYDGVELAAA